MRIKVFLAIIFSCFSLLYSCNPTDNSVTKYTIAGNIIFSAPKILNTGQIVDTLRFSYSLNNLKIYLYEKN